MWLQFSLIFLSAYICSADFPTTIVKPCKLTDYKCIGDNLAANSNCNRNIKRKIPSEYRQKSFHFDTPAFNASYIDTDLKVRNQDLCYVAEFFFNTHTKKAILGIECRDMELESDRTYIQHRTFREDSYYYFHIKAYYPLLRFTVNLPSMTHMDLCSANVFTDVVILPKLKIDPQTKRTSNYLSRDLSLVYIYERENLHARGKSLVSTFIDSLLCDYGCAQAS